MTNGQHLLLYDGVCGLCNRVVRFLLPRDTEGAFVFASLQSATGQSFLRRFGEAPDNPTTFYVVTHYRSTAPVLLAKSRAALFVAATLGGVWRAALLLRIVPPALLDRAYDLVARHRYRVFGRFETCPLPAPGDRPRFIDL